MGAWALGQGHVPLQGRGTSPQTGDPGAGGQDEACVGFDHHVLALITEFFCSGISGRAHRDMAPRARLEIAGGLLTYVPRTHTSMIPVLKGLQLTIDSWQPNRDEGMKSVGVRQVDISRPRLTARWSRRWLLMCLSRLCLGLDKICVPWVSSRIPPSFPNFKCCPTTMAAAGFIFGDTSGTGFGQSLWLMGRPDINVFLGLWDGKAAGNSSKWGEHEFYNQVLAVKRNLSMVRSRPGLKSSCSLTIL
jgi:hypothetical protein